MVKKNIYTNIFDCFLVGLLLMLSLNRGGFYKSDILIFSLGVSAIAFCYTLINMYNIIRKKEYKFDVIELILLLLPFAYLLPIIFNNYADLNSSIFEAIRYLNLYFIYSMVKRSSNKKIYAYAIVTIALIQCVLSIDAVANRYLHGILSSLDSGYLNENLTRMSGTLQYANVLAIVCLISAIFVIKWLLDAKNKNLYAIYYVILFILISTIILTGSRAVLLISILTFLVFIFKSKENIYKLAFTFIPLFILTGIYTSLLYTQMLSNKTYIYFTFVIFICLNVIVAITANKLHTICIKKYSGVGIKKIHIAAGVFVCIGVYILIGISITKPLLLSSDSLQNNDTLILNDIKQGSNLLTFDVIAKEQDTRYKIKLNSVNNENVEESIKTFNYSDNTSGKFEYNFELSEKTKYLKLLVECDKGSLEFDNLYLNNKKQKLDYIFIPRTVVYRIKDLFNGSTSVSDRCMYYQDAMKIICKNVHNFVIGTGGEGFNNIYEQVKTRDYHSTEVHSSFLQIFVESGVIGFSLIIFVLIYSIIKSKSSYIKIAYILFVIHSFIDLNFSYMLVIAIFSVLLAMLDYENKIEFKNKILSFSLFGITLIYTLFVFCFCTRALLAQYLNIPVYNENNINLQTQIEVLTKNEKRVELDPFEYSYKEELDKQYDIYLELLYDKIKEKGTDTNILKEEVKNVLDNITINADNIFNNTKYNRRHIMYACSIYFRNIDNLSKLYYSDNIEKGYNTYMNKINEKLNYLKELYIKNDEINQIIENTQDNYNDKIRLKTT